jgi:hypothetical protein
VLEAAENGLFLTASPYFENEMHWHQGDGVFLPWMAAVFPLKEIQTAR